VDCRVAADLRLAWCRTVGQFLPTPASVLHGEPRLRLDLPTRESWRLAGACGIQQLCLVPIHPRAGCTDAEAFSVEQVLVGQLEARMWPSVRTSASGGAQRAAAPIAGIAPAWACGARVAHALDGEERFQQRRHPARHLAAGQIRRSPPACWSGPLRLQRPEVVRAGGWGGAWAGPPPTSRWTVQIPAAGRGLRRWARLGWPQRLVGRDGSG